MINLVSDRNILDKFVIEFTSILEKYTKYVIVSGYVAISNGRVRGTEDIDIIIDKIPFSLFLKFLEDIYASNFECIQSDDALEIYNNYLIKKESIRFVYKGTILPNIELKFVKTEVDKYTLLKRTKLSLTGLDIYFASIESTIAYKEHYLSSDKDYEDALHLRLLYKEVLSLEEIKKIKLMIDKHLYNSLKDNSSFVYSTKRDKSHIDFIEKWVFFMKDNSFKIWKEEHSNFLDSQILTSINFYQRLLKEENGSKKIREVTGWNKKTPYWFEK
ncbi:hypothetical protein GW835_00930 [archaeon]|nr:hypothetical protein [archaeon]NCP79117.1 hypothetical protein [archaeon]NCP97937.1 hypothetical protein [archaeon]NCQ06884.1 hypothetical protein [archaeon]NCQ50680.1 hypothetical protein [archaeon]